MHINRLVLTIAVIFVLSSVFGNIIHALLLHFDYAALPQVFRRPVDVDMRLVLFSYIAFSVGSVWLYSHGVEDLPWLGQGIRFGIAMWLVTSLPWYLMAYATQPLPESLLWKQLGYEFVSKLLLGIVTAAMVRKP
jgi:hypothetical protein